MMFKDVNGGNVLLPSYRAQEKQMLFATLQEEHSVRQEGTGGPS